MYYIFIILNTLYFWKLTILLVLEPWNFSLCFWTWNLSCFEDRLIHCRVFGTLKCSIMSLKRWKHYRDSEIDWKPEVPYHVFGSLKFLIMFLETWSSLSCFWKPEVPYHVFGSLKFLFMILENWSFLSCFWKPEVPYYVFGNLKFLMFLEAWSSLSCFRKLEVPYHVFGSLKFLIMFLETWNSFGVPGILQTTHF